MFFNLSFVCSLTANVLAVCAGVDSKVLKIHHIQLMKKVQMLMKVQKPRLRNYRML
jgi:hypothetical protein